MRTGDTAGIALAPLHVWGEDKGRGFTRAVDEQAEVAVVMPLVPNN